LRVFSNYDVMSSSTLHWRMTTQLDQSQSRRPIARRQ
jgi:hypothetical protein